MSNCNSISDITLQLNVVNPVSVLLGHSNLVTKALSRLSDQSPINGVHITS